MLEKKQCRSALGDSNFIPANDLKIKTSIKKKTNISLLDVKMRFQGNCMSDIELGT